MLPRKCLASAVECQDNRPRATVEEQVRTSADEHRKRWLRGYRGVLGFSYLTLARPAGPTA